jgi:hypothetical protein
MHRGYTHFNNRGRSFITSPFALYVVGGTAGVLGIVYYSSLQEVPYTHRRHAIIVSEDTEKVYTHAHSTVKSSQPLHNSACFAALQAMGQELFEQIRAQAAAQGRLLPESSPAARVVKLVGTKVAQARVTLPPLLLCSTNQRLNDCCRPLLKAVGAAMRSICKGSTGSLR